MDGRSSPRQWSISRCAAPGGNNKNEPVPFSFAASSSPLRQLRRLLGLGRRTTIARSLDLSTRETQIVRLLFDDETEMTIADRLCISRHTVHTHLERLYRKLGVTSRCELLVRVFSEYLALFDRG